MWIVSQLNKTKQAAAMARSQEWHEDSEILYLLDTGHTLGSEFPRSQSKLGNEASFTIPSVREIKISLLHEKVQLFLLVQDMKIPAVSP